MNQGKKGATNTGALILLKKGFDFTMPERKSVSYSPWANEKEQFDACYDCRKKGDARFGTLMKRRIFERDGDMNTEYKVVCPGCKKQTNAHRSKMIAIKEWEGTNRPGDGLRYRTRHPELAESSRIPNIALHREAEILKGDDSNGLK